MVSRNSMHRVAVVTGTSSGIGKFCAEFLLKNNFLVYGGSQSESTISHKNFIDLELEVEKEKSVFGFFGEIEKDTEVIDVFIHCAGISDQNSLLETQTQDYIDNLSVNALGSFNLFKQLESFLISEETQIINFFPLSILRPYEFTTAYSSSIHAKKSLIDSLRLEWEKLQISFTNIILGACDTPMWEGYEIIDRDHMIQLQDLESTLSYVMSKPSSIYLDEIIIRPKGSVL